MTEIDRDPQWRLLQHFCLGQEIGRGLKEEQYDLAIRSPAYRALMRSSHENRAPDALHSLDLMWEWAGRPDGKSPHDWQADEWHGKPLEGTIVEDRGDAGFFGCWESAGWYAHFLDPENFDVGEVCDQLY